MTTALVTIETLTPAIVFAPGGVEGIISKLETEVRAIDRDITTPDGRDAVKALAYKVARSKTALDEMGKELVADIKKKSGAIDAERRIIRDRLDALRDEVRNPLTEWENRETARVSEHEEALIWIIQSHLFVTPPTINMIHAQISDLVGLVGRDWQEFKERGEAAIAEAMPRLQAMLVAAEQAERDAAELTELRRHKAEREQDRVNAAIDAAEVAAQQKAEQAERDKAAAIERAVIDERLRASLAEKAEKFAQEKRETNKRHRAKVHQEITLGLSEVLTGNADEAARLIEAIAAGKIPHVSIAY